MECLWESRKGIAVAPLLLLIFILAVTALASPEEIRQTGTWVSLGPEGGNILGIVQHPNNNDLLYLITTGEPSQCYQSTDHGMSWIKVGEINHTNLKSMTINPNDPYELYVGGSKRIYKSTNGGLTWTQSTMPSECAYVERMFVDPTSSSTLHVGTYPYISAENRFSTRYFKTTNSGASWSFVELTQEDFRFRSMAFDPEDPDEVYIGGYVKSGSSFLPRIMRTTNGGVDWNTITSVTMSGYIYDILVDPGNTDKIYAASNSGIWRSTDGGDTWSKNTGWAGGLKIALDPSNASHLYAGYSNGSFKSTDGGITWNFYTDNLFGGQCSALIVEKGVGNILYGTAVGLFLSSNGGQNYTASNSGILAAFITSVRCVPSSPHVLYAGFSDNAVFKTSNALGKSMAPDAVVWERIPPFFACHNVEDILIPPGDPDRVYAFEGGG